MAQVSSWTARQAYVMATICLFVGIVFGFVMHGPATAAPSSAVPVAAAPAAAPVAPPAAPPIAPPLPTETPSPAELKQASNRAALPVLDQLKKDPKNFKLLVQAGEMYYHHGAFAEAGGYYERALAVEDNPAVRNQLASALYYQGKNDAALEQYSKVLAKQPTNDIALFNSGMVRFKGKNDAKGALQQWEKLLAAYPNHPQKAKVQAMIDQASKQG